MSALFLSFLINICNPLFYHVSASSSGLRISKYWRTHKVNTHTHAYLCTHTQTKKHTKKQKHTNPHKYKKTDSLTLSRYTHKGISHTCTDPIIVVNRDYRTKGKHYIFPCHYLDVHLNPWPSAWCHLLFVGRLLVISCLLGLMVQATTSFYTSSQELTALDWFCTHVRVTYSLYPGLTRGF